MSQPNIILVPPAVSDPTTEPRPSRIEIGHVVQFYENEAFLAAAVTDFLGEGLAQGQKVIVIARESNRQAFETRLRSRAFDVEYAKRHGDLTMLDAQETLSMFMVGAVPDPRRFRETITAVIDRSRRDDRLAGLRMYGEMVDVLWKDGNTDGAIRLEELWNELGNTHAFNLLCAYSMGNFYKASDAEKFREICRQHSHVFPTERYIQADEAARALEITRLQQRARALETEIAQRNEIETRLREVLLERKRDEEARARLAAIIESSDDAIVGKTLDGIITSWNPGAERIFGFTSEEAVGQHITLIIPADRREEEEGVLARLRRGERVDHFETIRRAKDGRQINISLTVLPIRDTAGHIIGASKVARDITERKQAEAALSAALEERSRALEAERAARAEAQRANRAKSEFLSAMSHELRTPLNSIGGYVELIDMGVHGPVTDAQHEALQRINRSQRHLLGLINDVLNLARIEAGRVEYAIEPLSIALLLAEARDVVAPLLSAKQLACAIEPDAQDGTAHTIRGDHEKVRQVLLNLLSNAIKFTPEAGRITLSARPCPREENMVCIDVRDTGIGIPQSKLERIFEPFVQLGEDSSARREGIGLGLAISRDLARGMGGDLRVRSVVGEGTTFTLRLPDAKQAVSSVRR